MGFQVCFTGRMPMRMPTGHVLAGNVRADLVLSRDEHDPEGLVVARTVEEVFERAVGQNPDRFLIPAAAEHGLTLDAMAELRRHAGAVHRPTGVSSADLFAELRGRLGRKLNRDRFRSPR